MTAIVIAPRVENPASDTESVITGGQFQIRPSAAYVSGGQWVQPVWSPATGFNGAAITVQLDPLPGTPYELLAEFPDGRGGKLVLHEFRIVPSSGSSVAWETCVQVSGPAGGAVPTDVVDARLDALEAGIGGVSGGASNLAAITDMSAFMRTVNDDTSAAAARTTLSAADSTATVNLTGAQTVAGVKTFSSSPVVPTPTTSGQASTKGYVDSAVSGVVAGSVAWTDITGTPTTFTPTGHTHPTSEITGLDTTLAAIQTAASGYMPVFCVGDAMPGTRPTTPTGWLIEWFKATPPAVGSNAAHNRDKWVAWDGS